MDSDQGKLFIGGISWETNEDRLTEYFGKYGHVSQTVIMRDKTTGRPRGFGFVVFADPAVLDQVLADKHNIDGRTVEAKRALSREEQHTSIRPGNTNMGRSAGGGGGANVRTTKIFVGGLPPTLTDDEFRQFFSVYGAVTDVVVMYDQNTNRPRGFGFITFDNEDSVEAVLQKSFHELKGKLVEVKRALPKEMNSSNGGNRQSGGGSYQSSNTSSYEGSRYAQPQAAAAGGYPAYGSSGYGASGYGYGAANNGYGAASYGAGSYGAAAAGYGGPSGAYGNPNAQAAGYVNGPPGAPRSPWSNQAPTGYGSAGYGANTGYGAAPTWNAAAGGGGGAAAPTGQSPSGAAGYGNQGYGYSGYGGAEGAYGTQGGYGAVGGRGGGPTSNPSGGAGDQGSVSGYMGGGYGDATGNVGYPSTWRSDPSQGGGYGVGQVSGPPGGPAGYGSGYGGGQPRQAQ